jgi:hypothetical protein
MATAWPRGPPKRFERSLIVRFAIELLPFPSRAQCVKSETHFALNAAIFAGVKSLSFWTRGWT